MYEINIYITHTADFCFIPDKIKILLFLDSSNNNERTKNLMETNNKNKKFVQRKIMIIIIFRGILHKLPGTVDRMCRRPSRLLKCANHVCESRIPTKTEK